jgi:hypothetical protein
MKKLGLTTISIVFASALLFAQNKADDIPVGDLPADVKAVVDAYAKLLKESRTIDEAAAAFKPLAGGSLVNDNGSLTSNTVQFGFKKDFNNFKHYQYPVVITRVNKTISRGEGYGPQKIAGPRYKIWIAKDDPAKGMPAPVSIIAPEGAAPRIVNVGSF